MNLFKSFTAFDFWKFFPLVIFIFNPKIDIISLPNYWQGIRLDDLVIFFYLLYYLFINNFKVFPYLINSKIIGFNWIIFFPYLVFSLFLGKFFGIDPQLILMVRYMEYMGLIIIISQLNPSKNKILLLFKFYIVINFIIIIFQYFDLIGGFTSRGHCVRDPNLPNFYCFDKEDITSICFLNCDLGFIKNYVHPGGFLRSRVPGITGGPWELAINLSLCIFALAKFEKNWKTLIPYFIMAILMLLISQSRGIIFGFLASTLFISNDYRKTILFVLSIFILIIAIYLLDLFNFRNIISNKFFIDYFALIKILIGTFTDNLPPENEFTGTGLYSMWLRAKGWAVVISQIKSSNIFLIFGSGGGSSLYTESLIIRIITSFGIMGTLFVLYLAKNLPLILIVFLLVTGITIDIFINFKIFLFTLLFLTLYKKDNLEKK